MFAGLPRESPERERGTAAGQELPLLEHYLRRDSRRARTSCYKVDVYCVKDTLRGDDTNEIGMTFVSRLQAEMDDRMRVVSMFLECRVAGVRVSRCASRRLASGPEPNLPWPAWARGVRRMASDVAGASWPPERCCGPAAEPRAFACPSRPSGRSIEPRWPPSRGSISRGRH